MKTLKKGQEVKILSVDLKQNPYKIAHSMKEFEGKIGTFIEYNPLSKNFVRIDMGSGIAWGFRIEDIKVINKRRTNNGSRRTTKTKRQN